MDKFKNLDEKLNSKKENFNNQQNKIFKNENEKEEDNEIIIELEIANDEKYDYDEDEKQINILCDKEKLFKDIKGNDYYYKKNNINPPKEFNYFNKNNTKLYLNDKEIEFNYKLKLKIKEAIKIKIKSNIKLFSLSTMFYNCKNIINIKFIKFNTNNVNNMSRMFSYCENLSELNLSSFNTNNVTDMSGMFSSCVNLKLIKINKLNIKRFEEENNISKLSF